MATGPVRPTSHSSLVQIHRRRSDSADRSVVGIDAVFVPATRGADALTGAARLAARIGATLVALCSYEASAEEAAAVCEAQGCKAVAVDVPPGYRHDLIPTRTDAHTFDDARAGRSSDLSLKRNLGLLLARMHGWSKLLFLDDDIGSTVRGRHVALKDASAWRLAAALDTYQIAGFACRKFPDNSVVCHARRMAGLPQKSFVSGAALGVNCSDQPLPFFPNCYNEDWLFFSRRVAAREIAYLGDAIQQPYNPFANPDRARQEEFGDLLAEGLFALFETQPPEMDFETRLVAADERYWDRYIQERRATIRGTAVALRGAKPTKQANGARPDDALRSLDAAEIQLDSIAPQLCVEYLKAWMGDLAEWQQKTQQIRPVGSTPEALDRLGLTGWRLVSPAATSPAAAR